jgi:hypothetical protein
MSYVCKRRTDDGWGCVNIYSENTKVACERHGISNDERGEYNIAFLLPGIETIYGNDRKTLKQKALSLITEWFMSAGWVKND